MDRIFFCIGGGEVKDHTTDELDRIIVERSKLHAGDKRPYALFVPTASHDCMPYYNSFHRVYTGVLDVKTEVMLTTRGDYDLEKIKQKFLKADIIYVGGGDTLFMLSSWKETGVYDLIIDAYKRGVIICGLSAGAIWMFENIYTDSSKDNNLNIPYALAKGEGIVKGTISPHYNLRKNDFDQTILNNNISKAIGIEDNTMIEIVNERIVASYSFSKNNHAYYLENIDGKLQKTII